MMKTKLNIFFRNIVGEDNYQDITAYIEQTIKLSRAYSNRKPHSQNVNPCVIYMADGKIKHGGLVDRLRGMVSLFMYCKKHNCDFLINFTSPFNLSEYIEPNNYNWIPKHNQICYNSRYAKAIIIKHSRKDSASYMSRRLSKYINKYQLHVYTNSFCNSKDFSFYFHELFKPTEKLSREINDNEKVLGSDYVSVTFRFQQLLGDFKEGNYKVLEEAERRKLIDRCIKVVEKVWNINKKKVLVTSDSRSFLEEIKKQDYVYTIPGQINHLDYTEEKTELAYMKSFIDLYMLSKAQKIYFYSTGDMYKNSTFAYFASLIGNRPYCVIKDKK